MSKWYCMVTNRESLSWSTFSNRKKIMRHFLNHSWAKYSSQFINLSTIGDFCLSVSIINVILLQKSDISNRPSGWFSTVNYATLCHISNMILLMFIVGHSFSTARMKRQPKQSVRMKSMSNWRWLKIKISRKFSATITISNEDFSSVKLWFQILVLLLCILLYASLCIDATYFKIMTAVMTATPQ